MSNIHISTHQNEPEYRMANTINAGQPPSNEEVQQTLSKIETSLQERANDGTLSPEAKKIALDTASVVQTFQRNIEDKNPDEKLQQVVHDIQDIQGSKLLPKTQRELVGTWADFKELLLSLVRSAKYRSNLGSFLKILGQVLGKKAEEATAALVGGQPEEAVAVAQLTPEEREKLLDEFVKSLQQFTVDDRFRQTYYGFLHLFEHVRQQAIVELQTSPERAKIDKLYTDIRILLERFTAPMDFTDLYNYTIEFARFLQNDPILVEYYREVRHAMNDIFEDPKILENPNFRDHLSHLLDRGREIGSQPRFSYHLDRILDQVNLLLETATNNPTTKDMKDNVQALLSDFILEDPYGNKTFDTKSLGNLVSVLTPMIRENLAQFKLPRMDGSDESLDWVMEDAILYGRHILPDYIDIRQSGELGVRLPSQTPVVENLAERLHVRLDRVFFHLKNVHFHYRQKTGLVKMSDDILADVNMKGEGAQIDMDLELDKNGRFCCTSATCHIDSMNLKVYEAKHNILYTIFKPILESRVKNLIETGIGSRLAELGNQMGIGIEKAMHGEGVIRAATSLIGQ